MDNLLVDLAIIKNVFNYDILNKVMGVELSGNFCTVSDMTGELVSDRFKDGTQNYLQQLHRRHCGYKSRRTASSTGDSRHCFFRSIKNFTTIEDRHSQVLRSETQQSVSFFLPLCV